MMFVLIDQIQIHFVDVNALLLKNKASQQTAYMNEPTMNPELKDDVLMSIKQLNQDLILHVEIVKKDRPGVIRSHDTIIRIILSIKSLQKCILWNYKSTFHFENRS